MNSRLGALKQAFEDLLDACRPVLRQYKVKYFKRVWNEKIKMFVSVWTLEVVWAYGKLDAAQKVNPKLRPSKNCWVTKVMPWEEGYIEEAPDDDAV